MRIDIISCVPSLLEGPFSHSIVARAQEKGLVSIHVHNLREYGLGKHKKVDDYPYGGSKGMVLMIEPIEHCIAALKAQRDYDEVIYMSPDGQQFSQNMANELSLKYNLIILCGHYKGIDERVRHHLIDREISIGEYVLSGGEIPAAVCVDAIVRLIPDVLGDATSALTDSFQDGLVAPPVYTRPANYKGQQVPDVLLSGHEKNIKTWEYEQQVQRTTERDNQKVSK